MKIKQALFSADAGNGGTGGAAPAATATPAPVVETTKPAATPPDGGGRSAEWLESELKKVISQRDELKKKHEPPPPAEKPKAMDGVDALSEVQKLRNEIAFERAVSSSGLKLSEKQRATMEKLLQVERPPDVAAWVKGYADVFGGAVTTPAQSQAVTNTGAPGSTTGSVATPDGQIPPTDVWRRMSDEDKLKSYRSYATKNSSIDTRFARRKPQKG